MRITWNPVEACFEAVFQEFQGDLDAAKAAGFKTTGPPDWKWYTSKVSVLDKLRKNRPASGLTILEDALAEYTKQKSAEDQKAALLAELKKAKKTAKESKDDGKYYVGPEGFKCLRVEEVEPEIRAAYVPPIWSGPVCKVCGSPVYMYEDQANEICIWCEIQLDNSLEIW